MIRQIGGVMQATSVWIFRFLPGFTPTNPRPMDVAIDSGHGTVVYQPTNPSTWAPESVYVQIDEPEAL